MLALTHATMQQETVLLERVDDQYTSKVEIK